MAVILSYDARKGRAPWDCRRICRRGEVGEDRHVMRANRCGFIASEERAGGPAFDFEIVSFELCPVWSFVDPDYAEDIAAVFELERSGIMLTRDDPEPLIEAMAVIRMTRQHAENAAARAIAEAAEGRRHGA